MVKLTFAGILLIFSLTGVAYFYLPENAESPTTTASQSQQPPSPRPENGRERYQAESQPLETFIPLGILAVAIMGLKTISE